MASACRVAATEAADSASSCAGGVHPAWRARAVGTYRLWPDGGFAVGALLAGIVADAPGIRVAIWTVAALTAASGPIVAVRMYETHRPATTAQKDTAHG